VGRGRAFAFTCRRPKGWGRPKGDNRGREDGQVREEAIVDLAVQGGLLEEGPRCLTCLLLQNPTETAALRAAYKNMTQCSRDDGMIVGHPHLHSYSATFST
jgi:hypothetical protein